MKNIWKKLRDCWLDFWEDDELDMDKKHLSQHDKRSLLYGGFMIGAVTFVFLSIGIMVGNIWTNHRNQKDMEELLGTIATYMATATDDEYEEIAQTIRHDLVYSQYGQDIENLIRFIPNTADGCCLERGFPERINLVFLNTGEAYSLWKKCSAVTTIFRKRTQAGNGHDCFQSRSPWTAPLKEGATIHHLKVVCCALPGASPLPLRSARS